MTTEYADILDIKHEMVSPGLLNANAPGPGIGIALISFTVDSTVTSGDTIKLGDATNGVRNGVTVAQTLATMIQNSRRDGRTVTLGTAAASDGIAVLLQPGNDGANDRYAKTIATSDTNTNITLILCDSSGSNQGTASGGMTTRPMMLFVSYTLS
jgi:hypothetical protein